MKCLICSQGIRRVSAAGGPCGSAYCEKCVLSIREAFLSDSVVSGVITPDTPKERVEAELERMRRLQLLLVQQLLTLSDAINEAEDLLDAGMAANNGPVIYA